MSQFVKISGKARQKLGTTTSRRLREEGQVPCNVYGHKQDSLSISISGEELTGVVRSGARVVELDVDGRQENVLIKDVQWDTFSSVILHADFLRVDVNERVKLQVPLQLKGTAPGVLAGGVLEIPHHVVHIECLAVQVPDVIQVRIGSLGIGEAIHARDLQDVPQGVTILDAPETVFVHVIAPKAAESAPTDDAAAAEPALVNPPKEKAAGKA